MHKNLSLFLRLINHSEYDKKIEEKSSADYFKDVSKTFKFLPAFIHYVLCNIRIHVCSYVKVRKGFYKIHDNHKCCFPNLIAGYFP